MTMNQVIDNPWRTYKQETAQRYILQCLTHAQEHSLSSIENYDFLDDENDVLLLAVEYANRYRQGEMLRQLVWAITANEGKGYLKVRGRWQALQKILEIAVESAIQEHKPGDWVAFRINLAALLIDLGELTAAQEMYHLVLPTLETFKMDIFLSIVHHHLGQIEQHQGQFANAANAYQTSLRFAEAAGDANQVAVISHSIGTLADLQGDYTEARKRYQAALSVWQELGEHESIATILNNLGRLDQDQGNYDQARDYYLQSLALEQSWGHKAGIAGSQIALGTLAMKVGNFEDAQHHYQASLELRTEIGDQAGVAELYHNLGHLAYRRSQFDKAREHYQRSLDLKNKLGNQVGAARTKGQLGSLAFELGDLDEAETYYHESLEIFQKEDVKDGLASIYQQLGLLSQQRGIQTTDLDARTQFFAHAREFYIQSLKLDEEMGDQDGVAKSLHQLGNLFANIEDFEKARQFFLQSLAIKRKLNDRLGMARTLGEWANLQVLAQGEEAWLEAEAIFKRIIKEFLDVGEHISASDAAKRLAKLLETQGRLEEAQALRDELIHPYRTKGAGEHEQVKEDDDSTQKANA